MPRARTTPPPSSERASRPVILKGIALFMPLRVTDRSGEGLGLDVSQHGEEAYGTGEGAILVLPDLVPPVTTPAPEPAGERA